MLTGRVSVVKALQDFFSNDPNPAYAKKVSVEEFKALSVNDKSEFVDMLRVVGYDVMDYTPPAPGTHTVTAS